VRNVQRLMLSSNPRVGDPSLPSLLSLSRSLQ
jgi:hypothetical protein